MAGHVISARAHGDRKEIARLPGCPEVVAAARERGVEDIVHFTTVSGAIGVCWRPVPLRAASACRKIDIWNMCIVPT